MKKLFVFIFLIILYSSLVFAETSATLTIKGYKDSSHKDDNLPTAGDLKVSVYDARTTKLVDYRVDITDDLENYKAGYQDLFSIKLQTRLKADVTVSIQFSPFVNQKNSEDSISASYKLSAIGTDYIYRYDTSRGGLFSTTYKSSFVKHSPTLKIGSSTLSSSESKNSYEISVSEAKTASTSIVQNITTYTASKSSTSSYPAITDVSDSDWKKYAYNSSSLYKIENDAYVESVIYVQMKLDLEDGYTVQKNVYYKAPVKITVSAE